jgi:hypothetical protein
MKLRQAEKYPKAKILNPNPDTLVAFRDSLFTCAEIIAFSGIRSAKGRRNDNKCPDKKENEQRIPSEGRRVVHSLGPQH